MKINATVSTVSDDGGRENLSIIVEGKHVGASEFAGNVRLTISAPNTAANRRAFYVGRSVTVEVTPR